MKFLDVFKGLTSEYFLRQLFFGALIAGLLIYMDFQGRGEVNYGLIAMAVINTILYPYSRFAYESIIEFLLGNNMFIHNILVFFIWKFFTMTLCWGLAVFIAPIGLLFIYIYKKKQKEEEISN